MLLSLQYLLIVIRFDYFLSDFVQRAFKNICGLAPHHGLKIIISTAGMTGAAWGLCNKGGRRGRGFKHKIGPYGG